MRLYTVEKNGEELLAADGGDGRKVLVRSLGIDAKDMNDLILYWDTYEEPLRKGLNDAKGEEIVLPEPGAAKEQEGYRILAPIPVPRQDVICLGVNYGDHIKETVKVLDFTKKKDAVYFSKRVNRSNDPGGRIPVYDFVDSLDYEVELGVILKKDAFRVDASQVKDYILGYTVINDVSARNVQMKHQQWYLGKSLDGYLPMGPCIVTTDEIPDAGNLNVLCYVNGEKRQSSNTAYMITTIEEAVEELSRGMTLKAGTVIATGTPGGVAMGMQSPIWLKKGDCVRCEIEGIGVLENYVGK